MRKSNGKNEVFETAIGDRFLITELLPLLFKMMNVLVERSIFIGRKEVYEVNFYKKPQERMWSNFDW